MRKDVPVTGLSDQLLALAQAYGVATDYWDWRGNHVSVPEETIVGVLAAMDVDASTPEAAARALAAEAGASWRRTLPPCVVTEQGAGTPFPVQVTGVDRTCRGLRSRMVTQTVSFLLSSW